MVNRRIIVNFRVYLVLCSLPLIMSSQLFYPSIHAALQSSQFSIHSGRLAHVTSMPLLFMFSKSKPENFASKDIPDVWSINPPRRAIVTGANTGIGFETAKELARKGWHVILAAR